MSNYLIVLTLSFSGVYDFRYSFENVVVEHNFSTAMEKSDIKIVVVEDDKFYAHLIQSTLEKEGYSNIHLFASAQELYDHEGGIPDIVILDQKLGEVNGLDILKQIKAHNDFTQVLFLSGQEDMQVVVDSIKLGAYDYIDKTDPHAMVRMCVMLEKMIDTRLTRKELVRDSIKNWFLIY